MYIVGCPGIGSARYQDKTADREQLFFLTKTLGLLID